MSGTVQPPNGSAWLWNGNLEDWCCRDSHTQQIYLWNNGRPVAASSRPSRDPRHGQYPSSSAVRATFQPETAGSPPGLNGLYSLHSGPLQQPGRPTPEPGRPTSTSLPRDQRSGSSIYSTSPPIGPATGNRSGLNQSSSPLPPQSLPSQPGQSPLTNARHASGYNVALSSYQGSTQSLGSAIRDISLGSGSTSETPVPNQRNAGRRRDVYDETSKVRSIVDYATYADPKGNAVSRPFLRGTADDEEKLYPSKLVCVNTSSPS